MHMNPPCNMQRWEKVAVGGLKSLRQTPAPLPFQIRIAPSEKGTTKKMESLNQTGGGVYEKFRVMGAGTSAKYFNTR